MLHALRSSLRLKISLALVLVMVLPTVTLTGYHLLRSGSLLFAQARFERLSGAQVRITQAQAALRTAATDLLFLTQIPALRQFINTGNADDATDLLQAFLQQNRDRYSGVCLLDTSGVERGCVRVVGGEATIVAADQLRDRYDQTYFQAALGRVGIPGSSPLYLSERNLQHNPDGSSIPVLHYATAIRDERNHTAGVLVLNVRAEVLYRLLTSPITNVTTTVLDREGRIIFRSDSGVAELEAHAQVLWPNDAARMFRESTGQINDSADREGIFRTFIRLNADSQINPAWTAVYDLPLQTILRPVYESFVVSVLLVISALAITLLIAAAITQSILRPIRELAAAAEEIGTGTLEVAIPQAGADEIGTLGRTLATTVDQLRASLLTAQRENSERRRLAALIEASSDIVGITDADGRILYLNQSGRTIFGNGPIEGTLFERFHPAWAARKIQQEGLPLAIANGTWLEETAILAADGKELPVSQLLVAHVDEQGGLERVSTVIRDISQIRQAEERLRQSQKMEAIGQLAGGVAHDFNNLLTVIIGTGELVRSELPLSSPLRDDLAQILEAGNHAAELTRQLLAFSRRQLLKPELLNINNRIRGIERMLRRLIGEHISLRVETAPDLAQVQVDPGQIEQVLLNLAINARDAMPTGGILTIKTFNLNRTIHNSAPHPQLAQDRFVCLQVSDNGLGMSEEIRQRAFEPFFTTKPLGRGTGLGLATVHGIVAQSGGVIDLRSSPGTGTCFTIYLPAVLTNNDPQDNSGLVNRAHLPLGATVLLAEDEAPLRELVVRVLVRSGLRVVTAVNGAEALELAPTLPSLDLLIADVVMPGGVTGPQLAEALRAERSSVRVLFISGYGDSPLLNAQLQHAHTDLLHKPFSVEELLKRVSALLHAPS